MSTPACAFAWCENLPSPNHVEHQWNDAVPAKVSGQPGRVYVFAVAYDGDEFDDQVLIGIRQCDREDDHAEGWVSIEDAEYLRDTLTKAIAYARRQITTEVRGVTR